MIFPPDFTVPDVKTAVAELAAKCIAGLSAGRRAVVQAGGCSGLWPLALAQHFEAVYTFEPAPGNFEYLRANVAGVPHISAYDYALGETRGRVGLTRPKERAGLWQVNGDGEIPMVTLDEFLGDVAIDAIVLDVEGHEAQALRGAERVILAHRPMLWFEFLNNTEAITDVLRDYGYREPTRAIGNDFYSVHTSRAN